MKIFIVTHVCYMNSSHIVAFILPYINISNVQIDFNSNNKLFLWEIHEEYLFDYHPLAAASERVEFF